MNITWPRAKCHLGAQCCFPQGELRPRYKCVICKVQLHSAEMGCSTKHGEDGVVRCINTSACQRRSKPSRKTPTGKGGGNKRKSSGKKTNTSVAPNPVQKKKTREDPGPPRVAAIAVTNIDTVSTSGGDPKQVQKQTTGGGRPAAPKVAAVSGTNIPTVSTGGGYPKQVQKQTTGGGPAAPKVAAVSGMNINTVSTGGGDKARNLMENRTNVRRVLIKGAMVALTKEQSDLLDVYDNSELLKRDKEMEREIRFAVRGYVWSSTKFVIGEGAQKRGRMIGNKRMKLVPELGNSHERPDFTIPSAGYQARLLEFCNYSSADKTAGERALFWKSYEDIVKSEIQVKRSSASRAVKQTLKDSKLWLLVSVLRNSCFR